VILRLNLGKGLWFHLISGEVKQEHPAMNYTWEKWMGVTNLPVKNAHVQLSTKF